MNQAEAQKELNRRLYAWAKEVISKEVSEDFPTLRKLQHNRDILCFLAWMNDLHEDERRLRLCLSLVRKSYDQRLLGKSGELTQDDEAAFEALRTAINIYHIKLPPTPDCNRSAPNFVKGDGKRCRDGIIDVLEPVCGRPFKRQRTQLWYRRNFGDWTLTTSVQFRGLRGDPDRKIECYHFLWRSDFPQVELPYLCVHPSRIDPIVWLGITWTRFWLISQRHEQLCAQAVRDVIEMFLPSVPGLVAGLGIND